MQSCAQRLRGRIAPILVPASIATTVLVAPFGADARSKRHGKGNLRTLAVRIEATKTARTVPPSFVGLSIEHGDLPDYTGTASAPNTLFAKLLATLGRYGNEAPTIRIGGHSTDQSWWNPDRAPRPSGVFTDIDAAWVAGLGVTASQARTPIVLGLNLGLNDPSNASALAAAAIGRLPQGSLRALEIGNEPDLFAKPRVFHVGRRTLQRARHRASYDFNAYTRELGPYLSSLGATGVPLGVGGFAGRNWDLRTRELLARTRGSVAEMGAHSYPLQTCGRARRRPPARLISRLLRSRRSVRRIARLARWSRQHGVQLRVSETNSAVCGGVNRVSNSFASALWGVDALFGYLKAGAGAVNFHTWTGAWYAPLEFRRRQGRHVALVRPLYYGMLLFAKATANRGQLVRSHWRGHTRVRTWATRDAAGTLRVVLLNVHSRVGRKVRVRIPGVSGNAAVERLTARSLKARRGVKLSGRTYGRSSTTGRMRGKLAKVAVGRQRGVYSFRLPAASAALLTVTPDKPRVTPPPRRAP